MTIGLLNFILVLLCLFALHNRETTMDDHYQYHIEHPLMMLLKFMDMREEIIIKLWLRFNKILQLCLSHGIPDKTLVSCFDNVLEPENRRIDEHLFEGGMISQLYNIVETLLHNMVETNLKRVKKLQVG